MCRTACQGPPAGLLDLDQPEDFDAHLTAASGKDSATWIGPYLGLFVFGSTPKTAESAIEGAARQVLGELRRRVPAGALKLSVVAGDWKAAELSYQKDRALERRRQRASAGDAEAQWSLYNGQPTVANLVWLCRAADQGHRLARYELGQLYFLGSENHRAVQGAVIEPDLPRACMWFHLSGHAELDGSPAAPPLPMPTQAVETAEVKRTAKIMRPQQLKEAEVLLLNWEPGQCWRELSQQSGTAAAQDINLRRLCLAADQGDAAAREELGLSYFLGTRGLRRDLPRAHMWYSLAAKVYLPAGMRADSMHTHCDEMTAEQRQSTRRLLADWEVGQCERHLPQGAMP